MQETTTKKWTILVAEDDAAFRRVLAYQLTKAGYEVIITYDGREALNWIYGAQQRPDLVLLDLLMPHLSGLEVLVAIRMLPCQLPVILMSQAERAIAQEGVNQALPDLFLAKPFTIEILLASIERILCIPLPVDSSEGK